MGRSQGTFAHRGYAADRTDRGTYDSPGKEREIKIIPDFFIFLKQETHQGWVEHGVVRVLLLHGAVLLHDAGVDGDVGRPSLS